MTSEPKLRKIVIVKGKTSEIQFFDVDAEMFRRELVDYVNKLYKDSQESKAEKIRMEKQQLATQGEPEYEHFRSEAWWAGRRADEALEKIRIADLLLQELGFRLTKFNAINPDLLEWLKENK